MTDTDSSGSEAPELPEAYDVAEIEKWDCPATQWVIEDIMAKGRLNLMAAASYTGKSLLSLYLCTKLILGGKLFGKFQISPVEKILYIALEDPLQRIKKRLIEILRGSSLPRDRFHIWPFSGLDLAEEEHFENLQKLITRNAFDLVVLDTYQRATPGLDSYQDDQQSIILHGLADITRKHHVTILILDHLRKAKNAQWSGKHPTMTDIKGTGGKAQNSDSVILMSRKGNRLKISTHSKDSERQHVFELLVSEEGAAGEKFVMADDSMEKGNKSESENLHLIKAEFEKRGIASVPVVASSTGISEPTVRRVVTELTSMNLLRKIGAGCNTKYEYVDHKDTIN